VTTKNLVARASRLAFSVGSIAMIALTLAAGYKWH
jgi:hypothetical protein